MTKGSFELSVSIPRDGRSTPIREFGHNGFTYVESRQGQKFTLKFRNNSAFRVLAIPSIDGLNVLDGAVATSQSGGHVVPAYSTVEIKGWRTSLEDINDFIFKKKDSGETYSHGTGNGVANCGVIAVKVMEEKLKQVIVEKHIHHHHHTDYVEPSTPWPRPPWPKPHYPSPYCSTFIGYNSIQSNAMPDMHSMTREFCESSSGAVKREVISINNLSVPNFDMGTGFGEHRKDQVAEVDFDRGVELCTIEIYYASAGALQQAGVDISKKAAINVMPQAFHSGFCKAPSTR